MNIDIKNIDKAYKTSKVLNNINIEFVDSNVYGLLGRNGVGKTTLLNIILDLIKPDKGFVRYNNQNYSVLPNIIKQKLGVLCEDNPVIDELTPTQYLKLIGKIYHLNKNNINTRIDDLFNYFFDETPPNRPLSTYSTGMKKKIGICSAVIHSPEVLVLDEPFSGLDSIAAQETIDFIKEFVIRDNRLVIISAHDLSYIDAIASNIIVLDDCKVVFNDTLNEFKKDNTSINQSLLDLLMPKTKSLKKIEWL